MLEQKPYALSCDKNSEPILAALKDLVDTSQYKSLLEVGAGTGQHAISMAPSFLDLKWTVSDKKDNHLGISLWLRDFPRSNVLGPIEYEIGKSEFPKQDFDVVFTANTIHILSWELVLKLFDDLSQSLKPKSRFIIYGAFNYNGEFTSESNKKFNEWLQNRDSKSAIRDFETVAKELAARGFHLSEDREMPANNRLLTFDKQQ